MPTFRWPLLQYVLSGCVLLSCALLNAEESAVPEAHAPPNHVILRPTRGGMYYIAKPLKERHNAIQAQLQIVQDAVTKPRSGHHKVPDENPQLKQLRQELLTLEQEIEKRTVLVSPLTVHQQDETIFFDVGPKKRLIITADQVRLQTWDGPQVKCVLTKSVLTTANESPDVHFKEMRVQHRHDRADPQMVGKTDAQIAAEEKAYLATPEGQAHAKSNQASRQMMHREIAARFAEYRDFRGYEVNKVTIEGLVPEQGNRQLLVRTKSEGGEDHHRSDWQRQARLAVFVPPNFNAIAVRGCLAGIEVRELSSNLVLTDDESRERDYGGQFQISRLYGKLQVRNVPLQLIESTAGDINILNTEEFANFGTIEERGLRANLTPPAGHLTIRHIAGNLAAWFARTDLTVSDVAGKIDVQNDFGNTVYVSRNTMTVQGHRIISQSGHIEANLSAEPLTLLRIHALTNHGKVSTNVADDRLEVVRFSTYDLVTHSRRQWHGIASVRKESPGQVLIERQGRPALVMTDGSRHPGIDLISRSGDIKVLSQD